MSWTIHLSDLVGAHNRVIASGQRVVDSAETRVHPVLIAMTPDLVAFNRHNSPGVFALGETVEVRSIATARLLWTVRTSGRVKDLLLGGDTVAVLEEENGLELDVADAVNPALFPIGRPASGAALSADGRYLSWDVAADPPNGGRPGVMTVVLPSGARDPISTATPSGAGAASALSPAVSATPGGPIVAWYATVAGGIVYPAFRDRSLSAGAVISAVPAPEWIALQGSTLILVSTDRDGRYTVAFAVDLARSGFAGS